MIRIVIFTACVNTKFCQQTEENLRLPLCTVPFDISTVRTISSNGTFLVLQPRAQPELCVQSKDTSKNANMSLTINPSLLVTDRLTHTLTSNHQFAGCDGKLYDWIRGPTAEGYAL